MSVETAANINTTFLDMAPQFVRRIEEEGLSRVVSRRASSAQSLQTGV